MNLKYSITNIYCLNLAEVLARDIFMSKPVIRLSMLKNQQIKLPVPFGLLNFFLFCLYPTSSGGLPLPNLIHITLEGVNTNAEPFSQNSTSLAQ